MLTKDSLLEKVFQAGVVGCGGAGFPTHQKLKTDVGCYIVNGAECEPLLRTDRYLMCSFASQLVLCAHTIGQLLGAERVVVALKESYLDEIAALEQAILDTGVPVELHRLAHFYPAGDEQVVVREVTGCTVPPAGIPSQVGATVSNVATVLAVSDALRDTPVTHRYLTVTGAVKQPVVLHVPIGTSLAQCLGLAGGPTAPEYSLISGGPLMGKLLDASDIADGVVTKTTSGLIAVPAGGYLAARASTDLRHTINRARSSCIQCSFCTQMCPRYLLGHPLQPHRIMRRLAYCTGLEEILDDPFVHQALICCECGVCEEFACPMSLQPRRINSMLKAEYARAAVRYQRAEGRWEAREERDYRRVPTHSITARLGLSAYDSHEMPRAVSLTPDQVSIPLKQHIGAPARPTVKVGDRVERGQMIGLCPEDQLGACVHTGISGVVVQTGESIVIEKREADAQ